MFHAVFALLFTTTPTRADFRVSADTYFSNTATDLNKDSVNPGNQVLQLPQIKNQFEVRAEAKLREKNWQALIRPQLWISDQQREVNGLTEKISKNKIDLTDAFLEANWSSYFTTTLGLQVYQWGPSEFMNASNPFFHFNPSQKNLLYKEKGRGLVRANISFNKENSLVVAVEPASNQDHEWISEDQFTPKGFIKYEKSWSGTLNSVGISTGVAEKNNIFVGEYFNLAINDVFSFYADVKQQQNLVNYLPVKSGGGYDLLPPKDEKGRWANLGVVGFRIEQTVDLRFEYIYNEAGLNLQQKDEAIAAATNFFSARYAQNAQRFFRPGLELIGKQYFYTSLRVTDPPGLINFNFYLRWLQSMQDQTSQVQVEIEKSFLDAWTFYAGQTMGNFETKTSTSEFRTVQKGEAFLGLKYSF